MFSTPFCHSDTIQVTWITVTYPIILKSNRKLLQLIATYLSGKAFYSVFGLVKLNMESYKIHKNTPATHWWLSPKLEVNVGLWHAAEHHPAVLAKDLFEIEGWVHKCFPSLFSIFSSDFQRIFDHQRKCCSLVSHKKGIQKKHSKLDKKLWRAWKNCI